MICRLISAHLVAAHVGALVHPHMLPQTLLLHQSSQAASQGQTSGPAALVASAVAAHEQVDAFNVPPAPEQIWRLQQLRAALSDCHAGRSNRSHPSSVSQAVQQAGQLQMASGIGRQQGIQQSVSKEGDRTPSCTGPQALSRAAGGR